jgi:phosphatidylglycerol:prolipoprotein diacylglycerol transferase
MIDPVIFTIRIGDLAFPLRWYGVIVMLGVIVGSLIVERELKRRGENGDRIWDALVWVLPAGIIGARLWYVLNATLGGNRYYMENPAQIINIPQGGLHIFGGLLLGAAALLYYLRQNKLDVWLFLDSAGPAVLVGQAIGRIANFINQELYGPPTTLPWGIPISAEHRLPPFAALPESTRFHPTFAYEMLWNIFAASLLLWISRRYEKDMKPGALFAGWLFMAGVGRVFIEFFRPDQPKIGDLGFSYSALVSALMAITGAILLMARYKAINLKATENWEEAYEVGGKPAMKAVEEETIEDDVVEEVETPRVKRTTRSSTSTAQKKTANQTTTRKPTKEASVPATKNKKS